MENTQSEKLKLIERTNTEMLDYFNDIFVNDLEDIQALKTQIFEIDIKIDELEKTKDIYAYKSSSRKSVFSPIVGDDIDLERGKIIDDQISDLMDVRESLSSKIRTLEISLNSLKRRISMLTDAKAAISDFVISVEENDNISVDDAFEFLEEEKPDKISTHGYNILMQDAFDRTYLSTLIDRNIKDNINGINHKLEILSYLLNTDVGRAKMTLQEILKSSKQISYSIQDIQTKLNCDIDYNMPITTLLEDYIMEQREHHPECLINSDIDCGDTEPSLHPVISINIIKLLGIFFDNIFKHANATKIDFSFYIRNGSINVSILDNGTGIKPGYLTTSPWYSNLHKAHEIIYLLDGKLDINRTDPGTKIIFNIDISK